MCPSYSAYYVDKLVDGEGLTFRRFSVAAQNRLRNYPWPDNVRELKNLVRRLLLSGSEEDISLDEAEKEISAGAHPSTNRSSSRTCCHCRYAKHASNSSVLTCSNNWCLCDGKVGQLAKAGRDGANASLPKVAIARRVDFKSVSADE